MNLEKQATRIGRRAALVVWDDSCGAEGWVHEPVGMTPVRIWTLGWVIGEDDKQVTLAASASNSSDKDPQVNSPVSIPKCSIVKMEYLTVKK